VDFMYEQLLDSRPYRLLNVIDDSNCEGLIMDADFSPPADRLIGSREQLIEWRAKPQQNAYVER